MLTIGLWFVEQEADILQTIGKITVRWAALDVLLASIVAIAARNDAIADDLIFGSNDAGKKRLEKFDRAIGASDFDRKERERLLAITVCLGAMLGTRNDIVHSPLNVAFTLDDDGRLTKQFVKMGHRTRSAQSKRPKHFSLSSAQAHLEKLKTELNELEAMFDALSTKYNYPPFAIDPVELP